MLHRPHSRRTDHASAGKGRDAALRRGVTILELMVAIGVMALLAAMSLGAYDRITSRANFSSVLGNLVTSLRQTRSEAAGRGMPTAFVIDTLGNRWWGVEAPSGWTLAAFDPASPGTVIVSDTFPTGSGKAVFGPAGGYGTPLPVPFATVPVVSSQSPVLPFCSFCTQDTGMGAIVFQPNGTASFVGGGFPTSASGQQFTIQSGDAIRTVVLAVIARTGVVEVFEQ